MLASISWRPGVGDPTLVGWIVTASYLFVGGLCIVRGAQGRGSGKGRTGARAWLLFGVPLLFLGANKQLDFQTMLIQIGRELAVSFGWYSHRRWFQLVFAVLFCVGGLLGVVVFVRQERAFFRKRSFAAMGIFLLMTHLVLENVVLGHVSSRAAIQRIESLSAAFEMGGIAVILLDAWIFESIHRAK